MRLTCKIKHYDCVEQSDCLDCRHDKLMRLIRDHFADAEPLFEKGSIEMHELKNALDTWETK